MESKDPSIEMESSLEEDKEPIVEGEDTKEEAL